MAQLLVTANVADGPKQLSAVPKNFNHAIFIACNSLAGPSVGPNTGMVKIGMSAAANEQPLEFNPNEERIFPAPARGAWDLSQYYLTVKNDGDGIVILYQ